MTDLETQWRDAETHAQALMAEKDNALQKVKDHYGRQLQAANTKAAQAQKAYLNAQAADALRDRPDGPAVAEALGLTL